MRTFAQREVLVQGQNHGLIGYFTEIDVEDATHERAWRTHSCRAALSEYRTRRYRREAFKGFAAPGHARSGYLYILIRISCPGPFVNREPDHA